MSRVVVFLLLCSWGLIAYFCKVDSKYIIGGFVGAASSMLLHWQTERVIRPEDFEPTKEDFCNCRQGRDACTCGKGIA